MEMELTMLFFFFFFLSSQALDVGTLKSVQADTIRIIVWILSFMSFGYATGEFEVTSERLGVYRPEEHIDNPKGYADGEDARKYDSRLRPPVRPIELEIDPHTLMKNYIANERGDWATSSGYIKYSLSRSIHYGRLYTCGHRRNEEDLCEALRYLGQGLHTLEDFAAHTNYCELAIREMGYLNVFPHTGMATGMNIIQGGRRVVFPLVTGTFGMVDFFHSLLGEATDHVTQSEVSEVDDAFGSAQNNSMVGALGNFAASMKDIPGAGDLVTEAGYLKHSSDRQEASNRDAGYDLLSRVSHGSMMSMPEDLDNPQKTVQRICPILVFRDKVVRRLAAIVETIPGLETFLEKVSETLSIFVMSLLAPFIRPIIKIATHSLQDGSSGVLQASSQHQFETWTDPICTDPTHSLLSKDHFANVLNEPAGNVASAILKYVVPRVLRAWQHSHIPEQEVLDDCVQVLHHPALRDMRNEAHRNMFEAMEDWVRSRPDGGKDLNDILSAEGVRSGRNNNNSIRHSHHGGTSREPPSSSAPYTFPTAAPVIATGPNPGPYYDHPHASDHGHHRYQYPQE